MKIDGSIQTSEKTSNSVKKDETDSQLKSIQGQMERVREKMRILSENKDLNPTDKNRMMREFKMELQSLMSTFNIRQKEILDEKMEQKKNDSVAKSDKKKVQPQESDFENNPLEAVHKLVGTEVTIREMKSVNAIKKDMNSKTNVLQSEIKLNKTYFMPVDKKDEEIYEINKRLDKINGNGAKKYADVQKAIEQSRHITKKVSEEVSDEEKLEDKNDDAEKNGESTMLKSDMKQSAFEMQV